MRNKQLARFLVIVCGLIASTAHAEMKPFNEDAFKAATQSGKTIVLDFYADWCPTCQAQKSALETVSSEDSFRSDKVSIFKVDYDSEQQLRNEFGVMRQGTIIVLKGTAECVRLVGVTEPGELRKVISRGIEGC